MVQNQVARAWASPQSAAAEPAAEGKHAATMAMIMELCPAAASVQDKNGRLAAHRVFTVLRHWNWLEDEGTLLGVLRYLVASHPEGLLTADMNGDHPAVAPQWRQVGDAPTSRRVGVAYNIILLLRIIGDSHSCTAVGKLRVLGKRCEMKVLE